MKEIDWSKAPEEATHYSPAAFGCYAAFWQLDGEKVVQSWVFEEKDRLEHYVNGAMSQGTRQRLIARPAPWTGEGLPPTGTVCEVLNNTLDHPEWERCTILFMGKFKAVYESESCHERVADVSESWMISFRPLRTPEQIAAEEREKEVDQMVQRIAENTTGIGIGAAMICAKALHAAGYRKVTP